MKVNIGLALATGALILFSMVAHADPQGKWWIDPETGLFSMVDPDSHIAVSGCTTATSLDSNGGR